MLMPDKVLLLFNLALFIVRHKSRTTLPLAKHFLDLSSIPYAALGPMTSQTSGIHGQ